MRDWKLSVEHFSTLLDEFPKNSNATKELIKAEARFNEATTGQYDLGKMFEERLRNVQLFDVADYTGPVEISEVPGKEKGLIATKDVKKGTLLLSSKAYTMAFKDPENFLLGLNMITNKWDSSTHILATIETIQKLKKNPQTAKELYALYAGDLKRDVEIPDWVIDTGRIEQILCFNSFEFPEVENEDLVSKPRQITFEMNMKKAGLWLLPSFINHSCLGKNLCLEIQDNKIKLDFCDFSQKIF